MSKLNPTATELELDILHDDLVAVESMLHHLASHLRLVDQSLARHALKTQTDHDELIETLTEHHHAVMARLDAFIGRLGERNG